MVLDVDDAVRLLGGLDGHVLTNAGNELGAAYQYFASLAGHDVAEDQVPPVFPEADGNGSPIEDVTPDAEDVGASGDSVPHAGAADHLSPEQYYTSLVRLREAVDAATAGTEKHMPALV